MWRRYSYYQLRDSRNYIPNSLTGYLDKRCWALICLLLALLLPMPQPQVCSGDQKYVLYWWEKEKDKRRRGEKSRRVARWPMYRNHKRFYACGLTVNNLDFLSRLLWPWDWRSKWIQARDREKEQMVLGRYGSWNEQRYKQKTNKRWSRAWEALQSGKPRMFRQPGLCGPSYFPGCYTDLIIFHS